MLFHGRLFVFRFVLAFVLFFNFAFNQAGLDCEYIEADTGEDGLAKIKKDAPDIIILEVRLPGTDGFKICKKIKNINSSAKVLLVSRRQDAVDHAKAENVGADQHTVKTKSNKFLVDSFKKIAAKP